MDWLRAIPLSPTTPDCPIATNEPAANIIPGGTRVLEYTWLRAQPRMRAEVHVTLSSPLLAFVPVLTLGSLAGVMLVEEPLVLRSLLRGEYASDPRPGLE